MKKLFFLFLVSVLSVTTVFAARCPAYNIGDTLPAYLPLNGYMIPVCPANYAKLGILPRVDAIDLAPGQIIVNSHGEIINGQFIEIVDLSQTQAQIDAAGTALHQESKPFKLKQAENAYLAVAAQVPGYVAGDTASIISVKLQAAVNAGTITQTTALQIGLQLLGAIHDVEIAGGSWQDLPLTPHIIVAL